ncbi:MAG TPA: twin-arginine translocation signal domain-containing protein [Actinomycetota bacterium]|nr:twin-arginine translocation signal domain-containing protein [Actinomycetota bacterium]
MSRDRYAGGGRSNPIDDRVERIAGDLATRTSRRSFVTRLGAGIVALAGGPYVAAALAPQRAEAHHVCGHTFTTGSCPHPFAPRTRVDSYGFPVHPKHGYPVDDDGELYVSKDQPRRKVCQRVVPERYPHVGQARYGGGWSRCCKGRIRRIRDCCSYSNTRINGDASVTGYCHNGRKVFCIAYLDTTTRC